MQQNPTVKIKSLAYGNLFNGACQNWIPYFRQMN